MYKFSAILRKEEKLYVALCPELDIASQGKTIETALANLKEAVELYLEDEDAVIPMATPLITTIEVSDETIKALAKGFMKSLY